MNKEITHICDTSRLSQARDSLNAYIAYIRVLCRLMYVDMLLTYAANFSTLIKLCFILTRQ